MLGPLIGCFPNQYGVSPGPLYAELQNWVLPRQTWSKSRAFVYWASGFYTAQPLMPGPRIRLFPEKLGVSPVPSHAVLQDWMRPRQTWGMSRALVCWASELGASQTNMEQASGPFMPGPRIGRFPDKHGVSPGPSYAGFLGLYASQTNMGQVQGPCILGFRILRFPDKHGQVQGPCILGFRILRFPDKHGASLRPSHARAQDWTLPR
jgi:hypothetical protein